MQRFDVLHVNIGLLPEHRGWSNPHTAGKRSYRWTDTGIRTLCVYKQLYFDVSHELTFSLTLWAGMTLGSLLSLSECRGACSFIWYFHELNTLWIWSLIWRSDADWTPLRLNKQHITPPMGTNSEVKQRQTVILQGCGGGATSWLGAETSRKSLRLARSCQWIETTNLILYCLFLYGINQQDTTQCLQSWRGPAEVSVLTLSGRNYETTGRDL